MNLRIKKLINRLACLKDGKCEPNCPFGVKVKDNIKKAKDLFNNIL